MGYILYFLFVVLKFSLEARAFSITIQVESSDVTEERTANLKLLNFTNEVNDLSLKQLLDATNKDNGLSLKQLLDSIDEDNDSIAKHQLDPTNEDEDLTSPLYSRYKMPNFSSIPLRISERKCMQYVYLMLKRQEDNHVGGSSDVGIINGKGTKEAEYPHMGALGWLSSSSNKYLFKCGASLISKNFMLTAAHCTYVADVDVAKPEPVIASLGTRYLEQSPREVRKDVEIRNLIRHPDYNSPEKYYDIGLVELAERVTFTKYIQPACLSTQSHYAISSKKQLTVTGWGSTTRTIEKSSKELLYGYVDEIDDKKCYYLLKQYMNRNWRYLETHQMCAADLSGHTDTCQGDSGGPLQYLLLNTTSEGSIHRILSVTSFGIAKCSTRDIPGIYTKVWSFIDWIESIVWP